MGNYKETKEEIKDRMIKTALDYWNVKKVENLDPFIRLLVEALAMQLHGLSEDISDIETRVMRRLSEILLPEALTVVHPAHAIMISYPLVEGYLTDVKADYLVNPPVATKETVAFQFYPVCRTPLRKMSVKSLIVEGNVYEVLPDQNKRLSLRLDPSPDTTGKVYIGVSTESKTLDLEHLSFYVDFPNMDNRNDYLHFLKSTSWRFNGVPLNVSCGLYTVNDGESEGVMADFFSSNENNNSVDKKILDYYQSRYLTVDTPLKVTYNDFRKVPMVYTPNLEQYQQVCLEDLLWFEVDFPSHFNPTVLSDLQICLNTYPVANKSLKTISAYVTKDFGVMPLEVNEGESFFDVEDVSDEYGKSYCRTSGYKESAADLTYTLRRGGCESFDKRDASELLLRLKTLLEDELSTFASSEFAKNTDNVMTIEKLLQKINAMPGVIDGKWETPYYLFVEPPQKSTLFYVHYWASSGANANGLRIGQTAMEGGSLYSLVSQSMLITPSMGGKSMPNERECIARFKYVLGSRDRIVTNNDIKNFCIAEMPELIRDVRIEKGISRGKEPGQGLVRTIDVHLSLLKQVDDKQKRQIIEDFYNHLVEKSPMTFNYRLFID